jgi:hypothetical protein
MNSVLAQIYGTGFEKAASADAELDFNNMSAAELLAGLEDGSIVFDDESEKVAGDEDIDLSQLTGAQLLELIEAADEVESEKTASVMLEKMASDGTLEYFDMAGRIMAHAYADEFSKVASDDGEIEIDLDEISGEQLMELMDQGYEFVTDESEKVAGKWETLKDIATAGQARRAAKAARTHHAKSKAMGPIQKGKWSRKQHRGARNKAIRSALSGAAKTTALYGGAAGTVAAGEYGRRKMMKKKD